VSQNNGATQGSKKKKQNCQTSAHQGWYMVLNAHSQQNRMFEVNQLWVFMATLR
jgi:hypothetical protein